VFVIVTSAASVSPGETVVSEIEGALHAMLALARGATGAAALAATRPPLPPPLRQLAAASAERKASKKRGARERLGDVMPGREQLSFPPKWAWLREVRGTTPRAGLRKWKRRR
jgi:hypothetical protein